MRRPEEIKEKIVAGWICRAKDDLELAEYLLSQRPSFSNAISFHSQQAAEKYLKAYLSRHELKFPKTHDLAELLDLAAKVDAAFAETLQDVIVLTTHAVERRYPSEEDDVTFEEAGEAVGLARKVQTEVERSLDELLKKVQDQQ